MFKDPNDRGGGKDKGVGVTILSTEKLAPAKKLEGSWMLSISSLQGTLCESKTDTVLGCVNENTYEVIARRIQRSPQEVMTILNAVVSEQRKKSLKIGPQKIVQEDLEYLSVRICTCLFKLEVSELNT